MTKVKRFLSTALCALTILGSVVGVTGLVYAGNSKLDVTASNMTGGTSKVVYIIFQCTCKSFIQIEDRK